MGGVLRVILLERSFHRPPRSRAPRWRGADNGLTIRITAGEKGHHLRGVFRHIEVHHLLVELLSLGRQHLLAAHQGSVARQGCSLALGEFDAIQG